MNFTNLILMQPTHNKLNLFNSFEENSQSQIDAKMGVQECRICLQSQADSQQTLFSPCNCIGTMKYVHHECLQSWIGKIVNKSDKKIDSQKAYINCELCHGKISFDVKKVFKCKDRQEIMEIMRKDIKTLIALIALLLINISFFFAILDYLIKFGFNTIRKNNQVLVSLLLSGQVIFSIVATVTIFAIVRKFFLNNHYTVKNILPREIQEEIKVHK